MIKVLLADDNYFAVQYLEQLVDWEKLGFEIVGKAKDGEEAWEQYCRLQPQVVILDVQMPGKDGCEVARLIREKNAETVLLFLSSYDKFDYAREALHLSVQEYILKHELDEETLGRKLIKIREELRQKKEIEKKNSRNEVNAYFRMPLHEIERNLRLEEERYFFFIVEQDHVPKRLEELFSLSAPEAEYAPLISGILETMPQVEHLVRFAPYRWIGLCGSGENLEETAYGVERYLKQKQKGYFSVFLFGEAATIAECRRQYEANKYVFEQRYFEGNSVVVYTDLCEKNAATEIDWKEFHTVLRRESIEVCERFMAQLCRQILKERDLNGLMRMAEEIRKSIAEVSDSLLQEIRKVSADEMWNLTSARQIMQWLRSQILQFLKYRDYIDEFRSEEIAKAVYYICNNYQNSFLSVEMVAEEAGVSVTRLNELFKIKLNTTAGKFLTKQRMEKAGELLEEGIESITKISEYVGYNSTAYFSKAFRKYYGVSPMEWKGKSV